MLIMPKRKTIISSLLLNYNQPQHKTFLIKTGSYEY